jgi:hypothetical protein
LPRCAEISTLTEPASEGAHHDAAIGDEGGDAYRSVEHPEQSPEGSSKFMHSMIRSRGFALPSPEPTSGRAAPTLTERGRV